MPSAIQPYRHHKPMKHPIAMPSRIMDHQLHAAMKRTSNVQTKAVAAAKTVEKKGFSDHHPNSDRVTVQSVC